MVTEQKKSIDYIFLTICLILIIIGIFAFFSASLGVLARNQATFYKKIVLFSSSEKSNQTVSFLSTRYRNKKHRELIPGNKFTTGLKPSKTRFL